MTERITVLMPIAPGAAWLGEAAGSLLAQTHDAWELVAVLDGECAQNRAVLDDPRLRGRVRTVALPAGSGLVRALNTGLAAARTDLVARFDADDVCEPHRFAVQTGWLRERPEVVLVGSPATLIDEHSRPVGAKRVPVGTDRVHRRLRWRNIIVHPSVVFRRAAVLAVGGYDAACRYGEDYHLWLRLARTGRLDNVAEPLVRYRIHPGQYSKPLTGPEVTAIRAARRALGGPVAADLRHAAWLTYQHVQTRRRAWAAR
ncbi:glycosyltransferase [Actinoplanes sp. N902-109]|uniref:glycosyltransferase n=1 Tax=Actinoplanes sp. (strain N902-109) TaxID=649831 RepID=UPI00032934FD|nr:glycosyltransferase [Actinoplanes sp. N902-109]AGL16323.1 glycosyl transferase family 2 protein [Actinoplanes sp. N902-109]